MVECGEGGGVVVRWWERARDSLREGDGAFRVCVAAAELLLWRLWLSRLSAIEGGGVIIEKNSEWGAIVAKSMPGLRHAIDARSL